MDWTDEDFSDEGCLDDDADLLVGSNRRILAHDYRAQSKLVQLQAQSYEKEGREEMEKLTDALMRGKFRSLVFPYLSSEKYFSGGSC